MIIRGNERFKKNVDTKVETLIKLIHVIIGRGAAKEHIDGSMIHLKNTTKQGRIILPHPISFHGQ